MNTFPEVLPSLLQMAVSLVVALGALAAGPLVVKRFSTTGQAGRTIG